MTLEQHIAKFAETVATGQLSERSIICILEALCSMAWMQGKAEGVAEIHAAMLASAVVAKAREM
jgi:hypothetical protein